MFIFNFLKSLQLFFHNLLQLRKGVNKIKEVAKNQELEEAIHLADKIINYWSIKTSWVEQLIRQLLKINNHLKQLKAQKQLITIAYEKAARAKTLEESVKGNPDGIDILYDARKLYSDCYGLVKNCKFKQAENRCHQGIQSRQEFEKFIAQANKLVTQWKFIRALENLQEAYKLFSTKQVEKQIEYCSSQSTLEREFEDILTKVNQLAKQKQFQKAFDLLKPIYVKFPRLDSKELLEKLRQLARGKKFFLDALMAEKAGELKKAINNYKKALKFVPNLTESHIRLAVIEIKTHQWEKVISQLEGINEEQAAYLRGFAYAKQENWQQAKHEWDSISHINIQSQLQILNTLIEQDKLSKIQEIQQLVEVKNFKQAKLVSQEFLTKFGSDKLIESNLNECIQRNLDTELWKTHDWQKIAEIAEQNWLICQDIKSLHNWAMAIYFLSQIEPSKLTEIIISIATLLANIHIDPSLNNIPWLMNKPVELDEVFLSVKQILDNLIHEIKNNNIEEYLRLRDQFRLDFIAIEEMGKPPTSGVKINELFLTPGCYKFFHRQLSNNSIIKIEKLYTGLYQQSLYSIWGLAVAACVEGDITRAISIKPTNTKSQTKVEIFAQKFVSYHEGYYYLENNSWRDAINPLKQAKILIMDNAEWFKKIDKLCQKQRRKITDFNDHLHFAQFWYDLLDSELSRGYLGEYKAREVIEKFVNKELGVGRTLEKLSQIKRNYGNNPVVNDFIERIELLDEEEKINNAIANNNWKYAVNLAKQSRHQAIKNNLTNHAIKIFNEINQNLSELSVNNLSKHDILFICELAIFIYELDSSRIDYNTYSYHKELYDKLKHQTINYYR